MSWFGVARTCVNVCKPTCTVGSEPQSAKLRVCLQAWRFRELEFLARVVSRVEELEGRLEHGSPLYVASSTAQICTDKLAGLAVGLDESMAALGSLVATCSRLTDMLDASAAAHIFGRQPPPGDGLNEQSAVPGAAV